MTFGVLVEADEMVTASPPPLKRDQTQAMFNHSSHTCSLLFLYTLLIPGLIRIYNLSKVRGLPVVCKTN